ncbi:MAG: HD domain-containing protein [Candidatus Nanoarchaeia archaeon]|nr:HD domain-containing protein [Candidatus Nanoarchaeia archaeon]
MLDKALEIATKAHAGQKRKNGEDYINHCIRVSEAVKKYGEDYQIVGLLHDVIEDAEITFDNLIVEGFNVHIREALGFISKTKTETYLEYILTIEKFSNGEYTILREPARIAKQIKIADLKDNLNGARGTLKDKYELALYILTGESHG